MTTVTMAYAPMGDISQTVSVVVSQAIELIRSVVASSQEQISTVVTTITKPSRTQIVVVESDAMDRDLTIFHTIWGYRSAWIVIGTGLGFLAAVADPGPVTGALVPLGLVLWWLRYRELERSGG